MQKINERFHSLVDSLLKSLNSGLSTEGPSILSQQTPTSVQYITPLNNGKKLLTTITASIVG